MKEGGLKGLPHLQYTNFLSLINKESMIVSPVIAAYTLRKEGRDENSVSPHKTP